MTLTITTDRTLVRAGSQSVRYLSLRFSAPDAPARPDGRKTERMPLDISIVIDRSGSMSGEKLALAKEAAVKAIDMLTAADRVALVAYDTEVQTLAHAAALEPAHRDALLRALDRMQAGSSTNLSGGWLTGCEAVARVMRQASVARCLLLSDGLANAGITDPTALEGHAEALRSRGVITSTFGIGDDFDERLMEGIARAGGGNFYFIKEARAIPTFLGSELGEALEVVARRAELVVEADAGVEVLSLDGRRLRRDGDTAHIALDDVVARQETELVLRVRFPRREAGTRLGLRVRMDDADGALRAERGEISWDVASHEANNAQPREVPVDRAVASRYAAQARRAAAEFNRAGELERAQHVLKATARRIAAYAGRDRALLALVRELEALTHEHEEVFALHRVKAERMMAYSALQSKSPSGRRERR